MKTAFITNQTHKFECVFPKEMVEYIKSNLGSDGKCYTYEDVLCEKEKFVDTEFIFSTWGMVTFTEEEIKEIFPNLKCVFYAAGSVQYFAKPFLNCGVKVFSAWAANAVPVAEYTVAQIVLANKGYFLTSAMASDGNYEKAREEFFEYRGNFGAKIGIIGAGMIGKLVIKMLKNYKLEVLVFDPFLPDDTAKELGVKKTSLEYIFENCTVISNHLANNEQTKGMLEGKLFERMKPYTTFLNTGRGAQVREEDLIKTLKNHPNIVAVLDVTEPEPPVAESEFYTLSNCILTPHIAGSGGDEVHRMAEYMLDEYKNYISDKACQYEVTLKMLETMA